MALCAALFSIVVYSVAASMFGIPTSESHSLIAGLSGAAIAVQGGIGGINFAEWVKVLYGLVLSLALGFFTGWVICKGDRILLRGSGPEAGQPFLQGGPDLQRGVYEFLCTGAQDGQKFIGVLFSGRSVLQRAEQRRGDDDPGMADDPLLHRYGRRDQRGRREDHQVLWEWTW